MKNGWVDNAQKTRKSVKRRPDVLLCPLVNIPVVRIRYHYQRSAAQFKDLLGAHGLRAWREIDRAVSTMTWKVDV